MPGRARIGRFACDRRGLKSPRYDPRYEWASMFIRGGGAAAP